MSALKTRTLAGGLRGGVWMRDARAMDGNGRLIYHALYSVAPEGLHQPRLGRSGWIGNRFGLVRSIGWEGARFVVSIEVREVRVSVTAA